MMPIPAGAVSAADRAGFVPQKLASCFKTIKIKPGFLAGLGCKKYRQVAVIYE
jgi:hypothetical protein